MSKVELAREKPRFEYRRLHILLGRAGERVNHKLHISGELRLRRKKREHCVWERKPLLARTAMNQEWALDVVHDAVECSRASRLLSIVDAYTRECLTSEVDTRFYQPDSNESVGCNRHRARAAVTDPPRQPTPA